MLLLCAIVYKVFWRNSIFYPFENILIDLYCSVKCRSINGNSRTENHLRVAIFPMSQPTNLMSLLWGQYFCNLPTKSKSCCYDPVILQDTFILKSPQALVISTVRSLGNFTVIKTQIVVPQKLDISDFRGVKYNIDTINTYQFVGSFNFGSIKLSG